MIRLEDGEIKDLLPVNLISPETLALSYAFGRAQRNLLTFIRTLNLYSEISKVPEDVLNLLALEMRTQYYEQSLPRSIKEGLVLHTIAWYMHAGTPSVLDEFLATVLDGGYVEEWYQYGGKPYYFKAYAVTGDAEFFSGYGEEVKRQIELYKNVRSWLEAFMFLTNGEVEIPIDWVCGLTVSSRFPARADTLLKLDRTWKLNAERKLSCFENDANYYPLHFDVKLQSVSCHSQTAACFLVESAWESAVSQSEKMAFRSSFEQSYKSHAACQMQTQAKVNGSTDDVRITVINRLDKQWKLNGTRKLNGGLCLR